MKTQRAYKVELEPNNKQKTQLLRHCGAARWVYNWGLARKIESFQAKTKLPSAMTLAKALRSERAEVAPWLNEYSSYVIDSILPHCDTAFDNFFRRCKEGKKGKKGFPRFKSRKNGIGSMRFHKDYAVRADAVRFPRIGWVRLKEHGYIPVNGSVGNKFYSATVSEKAGRWFVSVQVECEVEDIEPADNLPVIGVDLGIKELATCSNGRVFKNPKTLKKNLRKLKRLQRAVSRKEKDSSNRRKAVRRLGKIHARVSNIRSNTLHNLTASLTKTKRVIVLEDLNVSGMMKNHHLAQAISDCGFGELRRQLEYKSAWRGGTVVVADRFFPSSKTCSACGVVRDTLRLSERVFNCECGFSLDRDLNAARNLARYTAPLTSSGSDSEKPRTTRRAKKEKEVIPDVAGAASETINACGCESSGLQRIASETFASEAGTQQLVMFSGY